MKIDIDKGLVIFEKKDSFIGFRRELEELSPEERRKITTLRCFKNPSSRMEIIDLTPDITTVVLENGVTGIGTNSFSGLKKLRSVVFSKGLTDIELTAFKGCTALESARLPDSINTIGRYAFFGCRSLREFTIEPDAPIEVLPFGLLRDTSVEEFVCPKHLNTIEDLAVSSEKLRRLILNDGLRVLGGIRYTQVKELRVPASVEKVSIRQMSDKLDDMIVSSENPIFKSLGGCLVAGANRCLWMPRRHLSDDGTLIVPDGIERFDASLTIGAWEFGTPDIRTLVLPASFIQELGMYMSSNLLNLSRIEVAADSPKYKAENGVLYSKDGKTLYYVPPEWTGELCVNVERIACKAVQGNVTHFVATRSVSCDSMPFFGARGCSYGFYGDVTQEDGVMFRGKNALECVEFFGKCNVSKIADGVIAALVIFHDKPRISEQGKRPAYCVFCSKEFKAELSKKITGKQPRYVTI